MVASLLRKHHWVTEVVVEHERTDPQRVVEHRGTRHGGDRPELIAEVIGHEERGVPEVGHPRHRLRPRQTGQRAVQLGAEPESSIVRHVRPRR